MFGTVFASVARKKCRINALFLDATTGQTRKRAYLISFYGTDNTEKRNRRKKLVDFVKLKPAHWKPTKYSAVCLKHILDYSVMLSGLTTFDFYRKFWKDDIGISIHATCISIESKPAESKRSERKVRKNAFTQIYML